MKIKLLVEEIPSNNTGLLFSPPKLTWKRFSEELPSSKQFGCYLMWDERTGEGTIRMLHKHTGYNKAIDLWAATYTHWAFYKKGNKRDHYG